MKTLLIILPLLSALNLFSDELKWVDNQIEAIKPPREGVAESKIDFVRDPFLFLDKKKTKVGAITSRSGKSSTGKRKRVYKQKALVLQAILNKSALINGKWYKIKDKIGKYTILSVDKTTIMLKYGNKNLLLSTNSKHTNLKFKNK